MIASLVIVFREMLEMVLVIGVLMAATRGLAGSRLWIATGCVVGLFGAGFFGIFMEQMESSFGGNGEFLFNALLLSMASVLIAWTVLWMRRHGRQASQHMQQVGQLVGRGELPFLSLAMVSMAAVMREGSEAVFFLFGAAQGVAGDGWSMLTGGLLGAVVALFVGGMLYLGMIRIPVKALFTVVGWLLMLLAAGMASQAAWNLVAIDWLPAIADPLWNSAALLPQESMAGELLHVLMGYDEAPTAMQVMVFVLSLAVMGHFYYRKQEAVVTMSRPQVA
ncbi:iron permease [Mariprofundus erugo]|uniref:Iron permease n=1 Tax=Mariprofundus erugo TaxID=2528639 RepID=A0A5R9GZN5_9PROT|nr:FTR1 family protein [Mariprofundus erugo]TLS69142.1 iron permease [Mariprofundus erugo]